MLKYIYIHHLIYLLIYLFCREGEGEGKGKDTGLLSRERERKISYIFVYFKRTFHKRITCPNFFLQLSSAFSFEKKDEKMENKEIL